MNIHIPHDQHGNMNFEDFSLQLKSIIENQEFFKELLNTDIMVAHSSGYYIKNRSIVDELIRASENGVFRKGDTEVLYHYLYTTNYTYGYPIRAKEIKYDLEPDEQMRVTAVALQSTGINAEFNKVVFAGISKQESLGAGHIHSVDGATRFIGAFAESGDIVVCTSKAMEEVRKDGVRFNNIKHAGTSFMIIPEFNDKHYIGILRRFDNEMLLPVRMVYHSEIKLSEE